MIKTIDQGLLDRLQPHTVILHQANCIGVAGAGVARQIKDKIPGWFDDYARYCEQRSPDELLGTFHSHDAGPDLKICSVFGQKDIGRERRQTDYEAWKKALPEIEKQLAIRKLKGDVWTVRVPYGIGCGLGGGDWDVMRDLFEFYVGDSPVDFVFCRLPGLPKEACF